MLARLNRLASPTPAAAPVVEPTSLPTIVEADPSFPALDRASTQVIESLTDSLALSPADTIPDAVFAVSTLDAPTAAMETLVAAPVSPEPQPQPQPEPVVVRQATRSTTVKRRKPRVRRVTRVVRHVDTWSVFKVALVFNVLLYLVCLTAGVLLWNVAHATGTIDNLEKFFEQFGWETFEFNGGEIYHSAWIAGLFAAVGLTGFAVLLAALFNLITDLVGGIRVSVLEEEVVARAPARESDRSVSTVPVERSNG